MLSFITYFTKEAAIHANKITTSEYGQPHVVQQEANLDFALDRMEKYAEDSKDEEEKLFRKAAYLARYLAHEGHIFADGNKRTTFTLVKALLELNGYTIPYVSDEVEIERAKFMKEIAQGKHSVTHICNELRKMTVKK
jgi:death-on-curing family protein